MNSTGAHSERVDWSKDKDSNKPIAVLSLRGSAMQRSSELHSPAHNATGGQQTAFLPVIEEKRGSRR